jgi:hypothetical protein
MGFHVGTIVTVCTDNGGLYSADYTERPGVIVTVTRMVRIRTSEGDQLFVPIERGRARGCTNVWFESRAANPDLSSEAREEAWMTRLQAFSERLPSSFTRD